MHLDPPPPRRVILGTLASARMAFRGGRPYFLGMSPYTHQHKADLQLHCHVTAPPRLPKACLVRVMRRESWTVAYGGISYTRPHKARQCEISSGFRRNARNVGCSQRACRRLHYRILHICVCNHTHDGQNASGRQRVISVHNMLRWKVILLLSCSTSRDR